MKDREIVVEQRAGCMDWLWTVRVDDKVLFTDLDWGMRFGDCVPRTRELVAKLWLKTADPT